MAEGKETSDERMNVEASLSQRLWRALWRALWYRPRFPDEEDQSLPCWIKTDIVVYVSVLDRIRLLLSGWCSVTSIVRTEHCPGEVRSVGSFEVRPPGGEW